MDELELNLDLVFTECILFFLRTRPGLNGFEDRTNSEKKKCVSACNICKRSVLGRYDVSSNNQIHLML